jgi:hypothetical protein
VGAVRKAGQLLGPVARRQGPALASGFVRQAFTRAVDGFGPLPGAAAAAEARLQRYDGDVRKAVKDVVDSHVSLAGAQGFLTNIGGLVTLPVAVPTNVSGLAMLQSHMVGGVAHLHGYDLTDPRVRNAVLACMLGTNTIATLVGSGALPSSPMAIATAPVHDPELDNRIATEVAGELLARVAGKRTIAVVGRRVPFVGGGVGLVSDGYATWQVGRYAAKELRPRPRG